MELMAFVETKIMPRYSEFGRSHGIGHVQRVIDTSVEMAASMGLDVNMAYVVAAYHDLGIKEQRATHHLIGGRILANDVRLHKWFSPQQIKVMKEAVEDHRASTSHTPRSIYGRIVAEADRELDAEIVLRRTVEFELERNPNATKESCWEHLKRHLVEKYSENGYIRLWIQGSPNEKKLKELRRIIGDEKLLRESFERIYAEEIAD